MAPGSSPSRTDAPLLHALLVVVVILVTTTAVAVPAFVAARRWEREGHYLKSYRYPDWTDARAEVQMEYARRSSDANDVLFLGDSSCALAIDPVLFESLTSLRGYNLGLPGIAGVNGSLRAFQLYLDSHPKPRLVVYAAHPADYRDQRTRTKPAGYAPLRERFVVAYGIWSGAGAPRPELSVAHYVREGLRSGIGALQGGERRFFGTRGPYLSYSFAEWKRVTLLRRGFLAPRAQADARRLPYKTFFVTPWYSAHIKALARICRENGIQLLVRTAPIADGEGEEDVRPLVTWLRALERTHGARVARPEVLPYDPAAFFDRVHLVTSGAERFTRELAVEVRSSYPDLVLSPRPGADQKAVPPATGTSTPVM